MNQGIFFHSKPQTRERHSMSIFDDIERVEDSGAEHGETRFAYWNRSGRPGFSALRAKVDELVLNYPERHRDGLVGRIRSDDDVAHESAMFELLLHQALISGGAEIEAIEPNLPHTDRSPDFLVKLANGERLYLEATLATGLSDKERRSKRLFDAAVQAINSVRSTDFWLEVEITGKPSQPVRLRNLRRSIEQWLAGLDHAQVSAAWNDEGKRDERPPFRHSEAGMQVSLRPIPKKDRREHGRAIGVQSGEVWSRTVGAALRQAIEGKSNRYGELDLPFVVAVNGLDHNAEEHDAMAALIGQEVYRFVPGAADSGRWDRDWDGVWISPNNGPRRQGVSGVLVFNELSVWAAERKRGLFVHNPWARQPLTSSPMNVDRLLPQDGEFVRSDGKTFSELLGWEPGWLPST
ncbi:MAG: hypothetical protein ACT6R7_08490 [Brevundimonas aurantiaca]